MGLCKCPKRQVTNQFCFEHRVNVCEYCLVRQHKRCIVQSYLQWLKDSDYDSSCKFCGDPLQDENKDIECVRLVCYHIFHWECFNEFQKQLPENTAPSGRKCPICADPILPPANLVSPVCEALRTKLSQVNWGRNDLGLPLLSEEKYAKFTASETTNKLKENIPQSRSNAVIVGSESTTVRPESAYSVLNIEENYGSKRSLLAREPPIGAADRDDNKYQRRTPREIFSRWSRRFYRPTVRPFYKKTWFHIACGIFLFLLIIYLMAALGRHSSGENSMLDMNMNPNIINHED